VRFEKVDTTSSPDDTPSLSAALHASARRSRPARTLLLLLRRPWCNLLLRYVVFAFLQVQLGTFPVVMLCVSWQWAPSILEAHVTRHLIPSAWFGTFV
jgi:hypothetical protein